VAPLSMLPPSANGVSMTCTATNEAPSLTLIKNVVNDVRAPTATPNMWVLAAAPAGSFGPGAAAPGVT
jgi:hypothetical protein